MSTPAARKGQPRQRARPRIGAECVRDAGFGDIRADKLNAAVHTQATASADPVEPQKVAQPSGAAALQEPSDARGERPRRALGAVRWRPSRAALLALVVGLAVTAALTLTSLVVYQRNETRLLKLRLRELNLVLAATAPSIQTPLASASELANATGGSPAKFRAFIAPYVGPGLPFSSVSLWPLGSPRPTAHVGNAPVLPTLPGGSRRFRQLSRQTGALNVTGMLSAPRPSLGFEFSPSSSGYAVYAENPLPANRRSKLEGNSAFSDLDYVLYLGRSQRNADLLLTSVRALPIRGRHVSDVVRFGAGSLTLVVAAKGSLGGIFFRDLPWLIAVLGAFLALSAAALTDRLAWRRQRAEQLAATLDRVAAENRSLYVEQRSISHTLQHALLPEKLPELNGLKVSARYVPAPTGGEVGGDWYDVIAIDENCVLFVIGDVSGHGLEAATTMALVRHAALAYIAEDHRPASVLTKLSTFVNSGEHDYFATVLCALIDVEAHRLTLASAGHMPPLLLDEGRGVFMECAAGPPIGVPWGSEYRESTISIPPNATVVAFTDGLVERRGEVLDVGLARLRELASRQRLAVGELLAKLAEELTSEEHHDDTALLGIQWQG
jgi:serine phosphatase RsbU (regulator of sigma subunit)